MFIQQLINFKKTGLLIEDNLKSSRAGRFATFSSSSSSSLALFWLLPLSSSSFSTSISSSSTSLFTVSRVEEDFVEIVPVSTRADFSARPGIPSGRKENAPPPTTFSHPGKTAAAAAALLSAADILSHPIRGNVVSFHKALRLTGCVDHLVEEKPLP